MKVGDIVMIDLCGQKFAFHVMKVFAFGHSIPMAEGYMVMDGGAHIMTRFPISVLESAVPQ